jgi:hypothetical protein
MTTSKLVLLIAGESLCSAFLIANPDLLAFESTVCFSQTTPLLPKP